MAARYNQSYQARDGRGPPRGRGFPARRGRVQAVVEGDSTLTWPSSIDTTGGNTEDYMSLFSFMGDLKQSMDALKQGQEATAAKVAALGQTATVTQPTNESGK